MIVVNKTEEIVEHQKRDKVPMEDLFRKELDAYCAYEAWAEETEDNILEMALEEIMIDEFLHAKFLRDYMKDKGIYTLKEDDPHEIKFWKIRKNVFHR